MLPHELHHEYEEADAEASQEKEEEFLEYENVYLLYGEEAYLKSRYRDRLKNAITDPDDSMNCSYFYGPDSDPLEIVSLARTVPFLSDIRLIIIENSGFFKSGCEELTDYLKDISESTYMIFVEESVTKSTRIYKAAAGAGYAVEFKKQTAPVLSKWILGRIKAENKQITRGALEEFMQRAGDDMENIDKELEKLLCYTMDKDSISEKDVEDICSLTVENRIFDMIELMSMHGEKKALELYYDLLTLREPPLKILSLISSHYNRLLQIKALRESGATSEKIAKLTGTNSYYLGKKYIPISNRYSHEKLKEALAMCIDTDRDIKTGRLNDVMAVELLIVRFSSAA